MKKQTTPLNRFSELAGSVLEEARLLITGMEGISKSEDNTNTDNWKTTLIVIPSLSDDFYEYLEFVEFVESKLQELKLNDHIQIASFHPRYIYEGTQENDVENWTNRSPYPILHLLREADVSAAIDQYNGNTDQIWKRNVKVMKRLGRTKLTNIVRDIIKKANSD